MNKQDKKLLRASRQPDNIEIDMTCPFCGSDEVSMQWEDFDPFIEQVVRGWECYPCKCKGLKYTWRT